MLPHGSDRMRVKGDRIILFSTTPKLNWVPRVPRTLTTSEHPGTAISWDDELFEVVEATQVGTSARYELEPWRDEHIVRTMLAYDDASEAERVALLRRSANRGTKRAAVNLLGMFAGYLPSTVQEELGSELGVRPVTLTVLSALFSLSIAALCGMAVADAKLEERPIPFELLLLAIALTAETVIRFLLVMSLNRPIGSIPGWIGYTVYWLVSPRRSQMVSPFERPQGASVFTLPPTPEIELRDKVETWAPFMTLLTPAEQLRLAETCGYEPARYGRAVAQFVLVFSAVGVVSSVLSLSNAPRLSALVSLLVAGGLVIEQGMRLAALRRGPAGSVLGFLVRPFVRKLLGRG